MAAPLVSVIVPVLRDTPELEQLLEMLEGQRPTGDARADEVIVVNGDPTDRTIERPRSRFPHMQWATSLPGRGRQMNTGAALAGGRWLLFLHADSCPDGGWLEEIRRADADADVVGGAFMFTLRSSARIARLIEWGVAWRVRWLGLPYGDQGLVVRRAAFDALHGFKALPIMEDVDFVRRLRRYGRMQPLRTHIRVSARRWERDGWARRTVLNLLLLGLYYARVSPARLARIYYGHPVEPERAADGDHSAHERSHAGGADATGPRVGVVMPALNEEEAIEQVLTDIPGLVTSVTVVDNGSTDATATRARANGARVVAERRRGYGRACLAGLRATPDVDVVVFLDADRSDYPEDITELVSPILEGRADLVMGDRSGAARPRAARFGTSLCVGLINLLWRTDYRDLGPFRAIRRAALDDLAMTDQTWGWTIEMQVKAAEAGLRVLEVPIRQRPRIGRSKISGTWWGTVRAGTRMLITIWSLWRSRGARTPTDDSDG